MTLSLKSPLIQLVISILVPLLIVVVDHQLNNKRLENLQIENLQLQNKLLKQELESKEKEVNVNKLDLLINKKNISTFWIEK